jgi:hypothetical protein
MPSQNFQLRRREYLQTVNQNHRPGLAGFYSLVGCVFETPNRGQLKARNFFFLTKKGVLITNRPSALVHPQSAVRSYRGQPLVLLYCHASHVHPTLPGAPEEPTDICPIPAPIPRCFLVLGIIYAGLRAACIIRR